jgi:hypothetical protein
MTPARGAGDIALRAVARVKGRTAPAATLLSPVARDYPSRACEGFFRSSRYDCSIKERGRSWYFLFRKKRISYSQVFHQKPG